MFNTIPAELSKHEKRFTLADVKPGARMRDFDSTFEWLKGAMTVNVCHAASEPTVGLEMKLDPVSLKCYLGDTGLLVSMAFDPVVMKAENIHERLLHDRCDPSLGHGQHWNWQHCLRVFGVVGDRDLDGGLEELGRDAAVQGGDRSLHLEVEVEQPALIQPVRGGERSLVEVLALVGEGLAGFDGDAIAGAEAAGGDAVGGVCPSEGDAASGVDAVGAGGGDCAAVDDDRAAAFVHALHREIVDVLPRPRQPRRSPEARTPRLGDVDPAWTRGDLPVVLEKWLAHGLSCGGQASRKRLLSVTTLWTRPMVPEFVIFVKRVLDDYPH